MYRHWLICMIACGVHVFVFSTISVQAEKGDREITGLDHGTIVVHVKGGLGVGTTPKPNFRPQDEGALELINATVHAGGTEIALDWSSSDKIRDELLWWAVPRHGDFRQVQAEVRGRLVFKPSKELGSSRIIPAGVSDDTPVPIIIVESLKIQLVDLDGKRKGPQHDRKRITTD